MFKSLNSRVNPASRPLFEALEPRWLLSADLPGLAVPIDGTHVTATAAQHDVEMSAAPRREIVFVDGGIPDAQALVEAMQAEPGERRLEVVVLDPNADGIAEVTAELAKRQGLDAIHLIGHGTDGSIRLGTSLLDAGEASRRAATLVRWHNALKPDADILLYGCRTAYGIGGERLLATLADLTGADVAGSTDATGAQVLGGNWVLERQTGRVDAALALSLSTQQRYAAIFDAAAGGSESRVNSSTGNTQSLQPGSQKQVAVAQDGSYVVVWASDHASSGNSEIYARRFNADGTAATGEIQVNTSTSGTQNTPAVACDASGNFVVIWQGPDANLSGTFARRFAANGTALAAQFQVNTTTTGEQREGAIAMTADGRFVIGWSSEGGQDGSGSGAYVRLYNSAGTAQTGEVRVNSTTGGNQYMDSIAMTSDGGFIAAGSGENIDGGGMAAFYRRFNSSGAAIDATQLTANTTTSGDQSYVSISTAPDDRFAISWSSAGQDGSGLGIYVQRFNADGTRLGGEFRANSTTSGDQHRSSIALDVDGRIAVTWDSAGQDGSGLGVYRREFNWDGSSNGSEGRVNTTTANNQANASLAMNALGQYVIVWSGEGTGDTSGVFAQRYSAALVVDTTSDTADGTTTSIAALLANRGADGRISLREAILAANNTANVGGADRIFFNIAGSGPHTITVAAGGLPAITGALDIDATSEPNYVSTPVVVLTSAASGGSSGLVLDAASSGSTIRGLAINGFDLSAIRILNSSNNTVAGNFLGTNAAGTAAVANQVGVYITGGSSNNVIGGSTAADRNIISGSDVDGVQIFGSGTSGNVVRGNVIGLDVTATVDLGNTNQGVAIFNGATNNWIGGTGAGEGNIISGNGGDGVIVNTNTSTGNRILGNSIYANDGLGIDHANDGVTANNGTTGGAPNQGMDSPVITRAIVNGGTFIVEGYVGNVTSSATFANARVEFFKAAADPSGSGEGRTYLGALTTNASSQFSGSFAVVGLSAGDVITATATDPSGNTSEFGVNFTSIGPQPVAVNDSYSVNEDTTLTIAPASTGLVDWYRFDDGGATQTLANSATPANTGTRGGSSGVESADPAYAAGRVGTNALSFDGVDDFVATGSTVAKTASNFTLSAWFKTDVTTGQHHILWQGKAGGNGWGEPSATPADAEMNLSVGRYDQDNVITFFLGYDGSVGDPITINSATFTDTTNWHHVAVVVSDAGSGALRGELYLDGVLQGTDTGTQNDRSAWSGPMRVGSPGASTRFFDGQIDEVRVYNTALSAADVVGLARAGVLENDSDTMRAGLSAVLVSVPANGTLTLSADGSFTYTPNSNFSGTDSFTYRANDGTNNSNIATATITVNPVNDAPVNTVPGSITVTEDVATALTGISVADVDSGSSNLVMTFSVGSGTLAATSGGGVTVTGSGSGTVTLTGTATNLNSFVAGSGLTFTTASNATSAVTLTVSTNDQGNTGSGGAKSDTDNVTLNVTAVNDAPVNTVPASITVTEDVATALTGISVADVDAGGASLQITFSVGSGTLAATAGGGVAVSGSGTASLVLTGTASNLNTFISGSNVTFTTAANATSAVTLTALTSDQGNTGTGGARTDSDNVTLNVTAVNDAPVLAGANSLTGITEDPFSNGGTLVSALLSGQVTDPDSGALSGIAVVSVDNTNGTWQYSTNSGGAWTNFGSPDDTTARLLAADAGTLVRFIPAVNYNGTASIVLRAWDRTSGTAGGTANVTSNGGSTPYSSATATASITVSAVNDAPTVTAPGSIALTEDVAGALTGISFADVDVATGNMVATFSVAQGTLAATSGGGVTVGGTATALTLTGTRANLNAFIAGSALTYTSAANNTTNVTLGVSVDDQGNTGSGGGQNSGVTNVTLTFAAINDAPQNTVPGAQTVNEDTALIFSTGNGNRISIADADAGSGSVQVTLSVTTGTLTLSSGAGLTFTTGDGTADANLVFSGTVANINAALNGMRYDPTAAYSGPALLSIATNDQGNTGSGGALSDSDTFAITVDAVNDPPVNMVPPAQSTNAGIALTFSTGNGNRIAVADGDAAGNPVQVTLTATNGTVTLASVAGLTFSVGSGTADATMTFSGNIADVNTALDGLVFDPTPAFVGAAALQIVTSDQGNSGSGGAQTDNDTVAITVNASTSPTAIDDGYGVGEDGSIVAAGSVLGNDSDPDTAPAGLTADLVGGPANATVFTLNPDGTFDYTPNADFSGTDTFTYRVFDGTTYSNVATATITVAAANDAPVNTVPGAQAAPEDTALVFSAGSGNAISIADVDDAGGNLQVTLTATDGTVTLAGFAGLSFSAGDGSGDALMTFTGTKAAVNAALDGLAFAPTANFSGAAGLQIGTSDLGNTGAGGALTDTDSVTIVVAAVNDAPVGTVPAAQAGIEDTTLVFSVADGNALSVTDVDAGSGAVEITLTATNGALTLASLTGLAFSVGDGSADATMTFTGSVTDVNAALNGLAFVPAANFNGAAGLTLDVDDQGNIGAGGAQSDSATVAITLAAVNDAPVLTAPATITVTEDTASALTGLSIADPDSAGSAVELTLTVATGTLGATSGAGVTVLGSGSDTLVLTGTTAAIHAFIAASEVAFTTPADATTAVTLSLAVSDLGNTGSGGAQSDSATATLNVTAVNDGPVNAIPGAQTTAFDTPLILSAGNGNRLSIADIDAGGGTLAIVLTATNGTLTLGSLAGLLFSTGDGIADPVCAFSGTLAAVNAALDGMIFTPTTGYSGPASVQLQTDDQGSTGGGALTDDDTVSITVLPPNNVPVITSNGGAATATVNAAENTIVVTTMTASDPDVPGQTLTWSIAGGADAARFTIDASTGELSFATAPDAEAPTDSNADGVYAVDILVDDGDGGTDLQALSVTVVDVNEFDVGPVTDAAAAANTVPENSAAGTAVGLTALATDADISDNVITYSLDVNAGGRFAINATTGVVTVAGALDFETSSSHNITVRAASSDGSFSTQVFAIGVTDANDPPVQTSNTGLTLNEGATATIGNARLNATDVDDASTQIVYTVGTATARGVLRLNGTVLGGGSTFTQADIDGNLLTYTHDGSETIADTFTFTVRDAAAASLPLQTFAITVTPVNDPITISAASLTIGQDGSTVVGTGAFTTADPDGPAPSYTVQNVTDGHFERSGAPGVPITTFTAAEVAAGQIHFVHAGGTAVPAFEVSASDGTFTTPFIAATVAFAVTAPSNPADGIVVDFSPPPLIVVPPPGVVAGNAGGVPPVIVAGAEPLQPGVDAPVLTLPVPRKPPAPKPASAQQTSGLPDDTVANRKDTGDIDRRTLGTVTFALPAVSLPPVSPPAAPSNFEPDMPPEARAQLIADLAGLYDEDPEPTRLELALKSVKLASLALSAGIVTWILRAGGLISSLLASLPAWRHMDPLPILARDDEQDEEATPEWQAASEEEQDDRRLARVLAREGAV